MLTGSEIIKQRENGNIVIKPFVKDRVQPNGYDITLGRYFYRYSNLLGSVYPSEENVDSINKIFTLYDSYTGGFILRPYEKVLAHTNEVIGTNDFYVAELATRSTLARYGVDICGSAGFGDVGYVNKWTIELLNTTCNSITLKSGMRVGQVYFTKLEGETNIIYDSYYNANTDKEWKPEDMLPKRLT